MNILSAFSSCSQSKRSKMHIYSNQRVKEMKHLVYALYKRYTTQCLLKDGGKNNK